MSSPHDSGATPPPVDPTTPAAAPVAGEAQPVQPANPYAQPADSYGQPAQPANPYAQPADSYGQPAQPANPYGQPADPYAAQSQPGGYPYAAPGGYPAAPQYGAYPAQPRWNVLSILAIIAPFVGMSLIGIVLGIIGMVQIKKTGERGRGLALTGIIVGSVAVVLSVIGVIVWLVLLAQYGSNYEDYSYGGSLGTPA